MSDHDAPAADAAPRPVGRAETDKRTSDRQGPPRTVHRSWIPLTVIALILGISFTAVYLGLQRAPEPRGLPIAVAGESLSASATSAWGSAVTVITVPSADQGSALVLGGEAVASLAATGPATLELDYAGGAGLSESSAVQRLVGGLAAAGGFTVQSTDIAPLAPFDSRGLAAFYVVFGVTLASFILAQLLVGGGAVFARLHHRLAVLVGFAIAIGLAAAVIAGPVLGTLTAPFATLALTLTLLSSGVAFATTAMATWLGPPGISLAVLVFTVIGNATSGATIGYDLLPRWAQLASAALPNGAATRILRDVGYFDGTRAWPSFLVLLAWTLAGLALMLLKHRTGRRARPPRGSVANTTPSATPGTTPNAIPGATATAGGAAEPR